MALPLAYFLSWTCYGQRVPGDPRGWVSLESNIPGTPLGSPSEARESIARGSMVDPPFLLTRHMIPVVDLSLVQLCDERGWLLLSRHVRPTHVHVVVNCGGELSPERAMAQLKARATRDLRDHRLVEPERRLWTRHGSTRWINHESGLAGAIGYVNDWQSGPNRGLLEEHRRAVLGRIEELRTWLRSQGLPESGLTVVMGETAQERKRRLFPATFVEAPIDSEKNGR